MASPIKNPLGYVKQKFENQVYGVLNKYGYPPFGRSSRRYEEERPPYERQVSPRWLKHISENHAIVNNSIEEKVNQTFRRGFTPAEKRYEAKCPNCLEEFQSVSRFKLGDDISDEDVDFSEPRPCPECGDMVKFTTPDPEKLDEIRSFFKRANMRDRSNLAPERHSDISQTYKEVCMEVAWDIQTFDDGWMIYEREYVLNEDGSAFDWELKEVFRAPPQLMRYSIGNEGKIGNEYWVCLECRAKNPEDYAPKQEPGECQECGNRTYEVFAYMLDDVHGEPQTFYTRGEFVHASEYKPTFTYGFSPVLSLWQEARTLEQMDEWYQESYEKRRAPRGAMVVRSSNAESVRAWNTGQMEKLTSDPQHIPTFIDDTEGSGQPIQWVPLLEDPAQMQHMQMREWFLDRISAKFGVTAVFQKASAASSGMSQSLEIIVANRSMERLKMLYDEVFLPSLLGQLRADGWSKKVRPPEEEDEQSEAQLQGRHLNNLQVAQQLGLEAEWTDDGRANIKAGPIEEMEDGEGPAGGGLGALLGGDDGGDGPEQDAGQTTPSGGRPDEAEERSGEPDQPEDPSTENPFDRADSSVTTGSGGYRNETYSGEEDPEVFSYVQQVRDQLQEDQYDSAENKRDAILSAVSKYDDTDIGPDVNTLRTLVERPDKGWQTVRRQSDGWAEDYNKNQFVKMMWEILRHE